MIRRLPSVKRIQQVRFEFIPTRNVGTSLSRDDALQAAAINDNKNDEGNSWKGSLRQTSIPKTLMNVSLFGPPGSGKGSYGKHFAKSLGLSLVTVSDLLRRQQEDANHDTSKDWNQMLSEGKLLDDTIVANIVQEEISKLKNGYILDGYPRTLQQVSLMEDTWPVSHQISSIIHLNVPDHVCETKLLGRRSCSKCGASYNINGVFEADGWDLPPQLPQEGRICSSGDGAAAPCNWDVRRDDDTPGIISDRLRVYHSHADPILDHFRMKGANAVAEGENGDRHHYRVVTLTPYRGYRDLPRLLDQLRTHMDDRTPN